MKVLKILVCLIGTAYTKIDHLLPDNSSNSFYMDIMSDEYGRHFI